MIAADKVRATVSAANTASEVGINSLAEMCEVIMRLTRKNFYKSMTTHADHRVWQDVYHAAANGFGLYIK